MDDDSKVNDYQLEELEKPLTEQEMKETTGGGLGTGSHLVTEPGLTNPVKITSPARGFTENVVSEGASQLPRRQ